MRSFTSSSRGWILRLARFLVVLVLGDQLVGYAVRQGAPADFRAAVAAKADFDPSRRYDAWIVGDSMAADAFVPGVLDRELGLDAFNWGVYASAPAEWAILLRDLELRAPFPKYVVLCANPQMLRKRPGDGPYTREFVRDHALHAELVGLSLAQDDLGAVFASGRNRLLARSALLGLLGRSQRTRIHPYPPDRGYLANTRVLDASGPPRSASLDQDPWRERVNASALITIREICRHHGAKLVIVIPPAARREMEILRGSPSMQREFQEAVKRFGAPVYETEQNEFMDDAFYDGIHLADPASRRFTADFARWLAPSEASSVNS